MTAPRQRKWTAERVDDYGIRMPSVDACDAVFSYGPTKAFEVIAEHLKGGEQLPFPVIAHGRRYVTPTESVRCLLELARVASSPEVPTAPALRLVPADVGAAAGRRGPPPEAA
jgi:hypothetical protein